MIPSSVLASDATSQPLSAKVSPPLPDSPVGQDLRKQHASSLSSSWPTRSMCNPCQGTFQECDRSPCSRMPWPMQQSSPPLASRFSRSQSAVVFPSVPRPLCSQLREQDSKLSWWALWSPFNRLGFQVSSLPPDHSSGKRNFSPYHQQLFSKEFPSLGSSSHCLPPFDSLVWLRIQEVPGESDHFLCRFPEGDLTPHLGFHICCVLWQLVSRLFYFVAKSKLHF